MIIFLTRISKYIIRNVYKLKNKVRERGGERENVTPCGTAEVAFNKKGKLASWYKHGVSVRIITLLPSSLPLSACTHGRVVFLIRFTRRHK